MEITRSHRRLEHFHLRQPACDRFQRWPVETGLQVSIAKATGDAVELPRPFFWFDAAWHSLAIEQAENLAKEMAAGGIVVAALHRDLSQSDDSDASTFPLRMAPHRCDRAGWSYRDCQSAAIIELRMMPSRDSSGRFAYHTTQLARWRNRDPNESTDEDQGDAMTFPPDWQSLDDMAVKVVQLRRLSDAAIFVSFDTSARAHMLPAALAAGVDGVIAIVDGDPVETITRCREMIAQSQSTHPPALWIATKQRISPEDAVKCFALGASGLAVDALCDDYLANGSRAEMYVGPWSQRVRGLARSCGVDRLTSLRAEHLIPSAAAGAVDFARKA